MQGPSSLFQTLTQGGAGGERGHGGPLTASSILGRSQDVTAFCVIPEMKRIVAADKRLLVWEYGESGDRSLTDPHACVAAHFSPERMQILTAAGRSDAETGRLIRVDRDIGEVTAMTGALVKLYERHRADVTAIAHVPADRTLVTASRDATIYVHDDSNLTGGILLRTIVAHANEVSCLALAPALGLIASGSIDSTVAVWDYGSARLEGLAPGHEADVTAIALLDPRPLLVTACSQGFLNFYLTRPAPYANRHELLLSHRNTAPDGAPSPVLALALDDGAGQQGAGGAGPLLYTGDDAGQVRVWSLRRLFEFVDSFLAATLAAAPPPPGTRPDAPRALVLPSFARRPGPEAGQAGAGAPAPRGGAVHAAARVSVLVNAQDRLAAQAASGSRRASFAGTGPSASPAPFAEPDRAGPTQRAQRGPWRRRYWPFGGPTRPRPATRGRGARRRGGAAGGEAEGPGAGQARGLAGPAGAAGLGGGKAELPLVRSWKAHAEGVRSIQVVREPSGAVVTASFDRLVHVFDTAGNPLGTLRQGDAGEALGQPRRPSTDPAGTSALRARGWRAPWSGAAKRERDLERARRLIDELPRSPSPPPGEDENSPRLLSSPSGFSGRASPRAASPRAASPPHHASSPALPEFSSRTPTPSAGARPAPRRAGWVVSAPVENPLSSAPTVLPPPLKQRHAPPPSPRAPQPPATPRAAVQRYGLSPRGPRR
eukprot:tig00000514_g1801.t1